MFEIIAFPLLIELDFVLHLWLGKVPEGALQFTYLNILVGGVSLTASGIYNIIDASGKIKWFKINTSFFFLMCIPLGWVLFRLGYPAYSLLFLFLMADIIQRMIQLWLMHSILKYDSWDFVRKAYFRPLIIACMMAVLFYARTLLYINSMWLHVISLWVAFCIAAALVCLIGFTTDERRLVLHKLKVK